jgi:hypothetical protein
MCIEVIGDPILNQNINALVNLRQFDLYLPRSIEPRLKQIAYWCEQSE